MLTVQSNILTEEDIGILVEKGLKDSNDIVRQNAAYLIKSTPLNMRNSFILEAIKDPVKEVYVNALNMIEYAPAGDRANLIRRIWQNKNIKPEDMAEIVYCAPGDDQERLWKEWYGHYVKKLDEDQLKILAQSTPLYKNTPEKFFRYTFDKTGSGTTLLGQLPNKPEVNLKDKIIIRHLTPDAYASWSRAFENYNFWKKHKFKYVPVEPIVRSRLEIDSGEISIFARVLGPSAAVWQSKTQLFQKEIKEQIDKINKGLKELGIEHGHTHHGNFCLVFNKDKNGAADITLPPCVYVIDFDRATSNLV
jgi:hypothetical protein